MTRTLEDTALELLRPMASDEVMDGARKVVEAGTHRWVQDPQGPLGLCEIERTGWDSISGKAVIVVYPAWTQVGSDADDFEVDDEWLEEVSHV